MRIYIVGSVASGKTTLAKRVARRLGIPRCELDNVVWENVDGAYRKRTDEEQLALFRPFISRPDWVIEDMGREIFAEGLALADAVVLIEIGRAARYVRIFTRWIQQRLGLEECFYKPDLFILRVVLRDARACDRGAPALRSRLMRYGDKFIALRTGRDKRAFLAEMERRMRAKRMEGKA
ncbi:MAG: DNA topology modulation protein FlaR [Clostridiales bacterium]|nr:DNA topology modulation protein FlaR [Clostridiales bacterium]